MPAYHTFKEGLVLSLILASTSKYRKRSLESLGLNFKCEKARVSEDELKEIYTNDPYKCSRALSELKSEEVLSRFPDALIIGGDQVASCETTILNKPKTVEKALSSLLSMRGKWVDLNTSLCVQSKNTKEFITEVARLKLREDFNQEDALKYIDFANPLDCAASFKIELGGFALFEEIECADFSSIEGVPLLQLSKLLRQKNYSFWNKN